MSMQTMPEDIAADIFVHCLPPAPTVSDEHLLPNPPNPPHPHTAPLLLLHVCRVWRQVALRTPRLWTELSLFEPKLPTSLRDTEALQKLVGEWFSRAGSRPLSFSASGFRHIPSILLKDVIHSRPDQLQTLHLSCSPRDLKGIPALALDSLPLLETLVLQLHWDDGVKQPRRTAALPDSVEFLLRSPKLQRLSLHLDFPATMRSHPLRPMLTTASLIFITARDVFDFIPSAPSLVHLECKIGWYSAPFAEGLVVTHDHLTTLRLLEGSMDTSDIFRHLVLPSLEVLAVPKGTGIRLDPRDLTRFLSHSAETLRRFFSYAYLELRWLDVLPGLTHVEVHHIDAHYALLSLFHRLDRTKYPDFLPQLRSLAVINSGGDNEELNVLADALYSRSTASGSRDCCLESCRVVYPKQMAPDLWVEYFEETFTPALVETFRALQKTGMEIFLGPPGDNKISAGGGGGLD
ncbi:hypothetical protein C8F01DRAFT_1224518 [Mycena amicta]|nr:hypothetical protein C8F01DRAFT_1224518 [Mycena amicta]